MIIKFLLLCAAVPFSTWFAQKVFNLLKIIFNHYEIGKPRSLLQMIESGELLTDVPIFEQVQLLSAIDIDGNEIEIEALDDGFDIVDIDRYKQIIRDKNGGNEIQLEY